MGLNDLIARSGLAEHRDRPAPTNPDGTHSVYLHAGHIAIAGEPTQITTILGSCVAICLWDPWLGIGGMNHYMLPSNPKPAERAARFADTATSALLEGLLTAGVALARLQAKVFGGASVLAFMDGGLGAKNVEAARELLARWEIPIVGEDVGGRHGRKLLFRTDTGLTTMKVLA